MTITNHTPTRIHILVALLLGAIAALGFAGNTWAQPGTLASHTKISSLSLPGQLDDGDEFGDAVASLGDLDGPGPSTVALAVGAINDDDGGAHLGAVYILFLDAAGAVLSHQKISMLQGNFTGPLDFGDEFGGALTSLGDLDGPGPGVCAIAVGTYNDDDGGPDHGAVHILFLNGAGQVISQKKISDTQGSFTATLDDNDEFGGAVAGLGDLDGAGPSAGALAVGCVYDDDGGLDRGAVYILFLDAAGSVLSYQKFSSLSGAFIGALGDGDNFGEDVAALGDLDGPGGSVQALAVGVVGDDDGGSDRGAVYILFLSSSGTLLSRQKISDTQGNFTGAILNDDTFGTSVIDLGDLDGPGGSVRALAVGAAGDDGPGVDRGAAYILFLDATGKVLWHTEISSDAGNFDGQLDDLDEFGSGFAALGDLDGAGPGLQTLVVGVGFDDDGGLDRGAAYLIHLAGPVVAGVEAPVARLGDLGPARPTVFSERTSIPFRLQSPGLVRIEVLDAAGRRVRRLLDRHEDAGEYQTTWDGSDDSGRAARPGAYFLRMSVDGQPVAGRAKALLVR